MSIVPLSVRNVIVSVSELDVGARGASLPIRGASVQLNGRTSKSIVPLSARNVVVSVSELNVGAGARRGELINLVHHPRRRSFPSRGGNVGAVSQSVLRPRDL